MAQNMKLAGLLPVKWLTLANVSSSSQRPTCKGEAYRWVGWRSGFSQPAESDSSAGWSRCCVLSSTVWVSTRSRTAVSPIWPFSGLKIITLPPQTVCADPDDSVAYQVTSRVYPRVCRVPRCYFDGRWRRSAPNHMHNMRINISWLSLWQLSKLMKTVCESSRKSQ